MRRMVVLCWMLVAMMAGSASAQERVAPRMDVARPVHTYSIVARDSVTGDLGVAVQSHWFSVGAHVAWAEAGVGAVATQSFTEQSYGPLGLALMKAGKTPEQALAALIAADPQESVRQVAMVDAKGRVAVHTGSKCIAAAGSRSRSGSTTVPGTTSSSATFSMPGPWAKR